MINEKVEKRYCGSCSKGYHHEDGSLRCKWLLPINLKDKCPEESELSYRNRLINIEICPNCKTKYEWQDYYLGHCCICKEKIKFN